MRYSRLFARTFRKYQTFRNHVYAIHGICTGTPHDHGDKETTLITEQNEGEDDVYVQGVPYDHDISQDDVTDDALQRAAALFVLKTRTTEFHYL